MRRAFTALSMLFLAVSFSAGCEDPPECDPAVVGSCPLYQVCIGYVCLSDGDADGLADNIDNCPGMANRPQADTDHDGAGDACDNCLADANDDQADADLDTVGDVCDVCPADPDTNQTDTDDDGVGDVCDVCPDDYDEDQADGDSDGVGDLCDVCPTTADKEQATLATTASPLPIPTRKITTTMVPATCVTIVRSSRISTRMPGSAIPTSPSARRYRSTTPMKAPSVQRSPLVQEVPYT